MRQLAEFVWGPKDAIDLTVVVVCVVVITIAWLLDLFDRWRIKRKQKKRNQR
ncbi:hypothetical protein LCGC14_0273970 [marine sediment metagenome]|uniref:Uncharacterized protein n=1 Tax=marine sediment metagenome TaxID=412755 RepID=A0A0F9TY81_9ZZZZ